MHQPSGWPQVGVIKKSAWKHTSGMSPFHALHRVWVWTIPNNWFFLTIVTNLSLSRIIHFYLYVFALTLDFPSASIKCSTYVTSPTTNQIPETTHTKGREAERQLGFRAETSWEAGVHQLRPPILSLPTARQTGTGLQKASVSLWKKEGLLSLSLLNVSWSHENNGLRTTTVETAISLSLWMKQTPTSSLGKFTEFYSSRQNPSND